jgi:hypothetical protein
VPSSLASKYLVLDPPTVALAADAFNDACAKMTAFTANTSHGRETIAQRILQMIVLGERNVTDLSSDAICYAKVRMIAL